jgi:hypothetical protein
METTKITTASIRIALSHNYNTFEVSAQLENLNGITNSDIESTRKDIQALATSAVNDYKGQPNQNPKVELQRIENKLNDIKKLVNEKQPEKEAEDPKEVTKVEAMPLYTDVKKPKKAIKK